MRYTIAETEMKKSSVDIMIFSFAGVCILCSFLLAYIPRHPDKEGSDGVIDFSLYEDHTAEADIDFITENPTTFVQQDRPVLFRSRSNSAFWIRLRIRDPQKPGDERFIMIHNASLENVDAWFPDGTCVRVGKRVDIRSIQIKTRVWNIPVPASVREGDYVYLRVKSPTIMWVPVKILTSSQILNQSFRENLLFGVFFGVLIAVFFVNLFSYMVMKNRHFLIYMSYLLSLLVYHLMVHGFLHFIPMPFKALEILLWVSLAGVGVFMSLFAKRFLDLKDRLPFVNIVLDVILGLFAVQTIIGILGLSVLANQIAYVTGFVTPLIIIATTIKLYFSGFQEVRFYLIAWFALFAATLIWSTAAYAEAQIPANYFFLIGTSINSLLFTLAIFDLLRKELSEKDVMVEREKYYINLSRTDPLTGLYNRRYLNELVKRLEADGELPTDSAMIMIDLDNFKVINDTHGHLAGDMILTKTGSKIKKHIRKTDIACRYGGDEFLVFLPGANEVAAHGIAEAIRNDILGDFSYSEEGEEIHITVSIGISENRLDDSFDGLFLRADAALYQAKKTGRNKISVL